MDKFEHGLDRTDEWAKEMSIEDAFESAPKFARKMVEKNKDDRFICEECNEHVVSQKLFEDKHGWTKTCKGCGREVCIGVAPRCPHCNEFIVDWEAELDKIGIGTKVFSKIEAKKLKGEWEIKWTK